jgi:hypothetical protein
MPSLKTRIVGFLISRPKGVDLNQNRFKSKSEATIIDLERSTDQRNHLNRLQSSPQGHQKWDVSTLRNQPM